VLPEADELDDELVLVDVVVEEVDVVEEEVPEGVLVAAAQGVDGLLGHGFACGPEDVPGVEFEPLTPSSTPAIRIMYVDTKNATTAIPSVSRTRS
jgi:hypothetical protein